jgi:MSHA biogenesis protein MshQ
MGETIDIRYGRLLLENSFGPEFDELPVRLQAQYWDGNRFATNTLDNCSPISASRLQLTPATLSPQATASALTAGQSRNRDLYLPAPGVPGVIAAEYLVPAWLQYDWLNNGNFTDNPRAEFIFGRFRGNPRQIFWREVF